jgi:hypothetical protein
MGNLRKIKKACWAAPTNSVPPATNQGTEPLDLDAHELETILARAKTAPMSEEEYTKLHAAIETLIFLTGGAGEKARLDPTAQATALWGYYGKHP